MSSKTTLEQIALAAGVSLSTVDRVVNRRGGVSPKAEAKVLEWASRLNLDRRIFRSHLRSLRIAVLMQSPHNPFFRALRDAFTEENVSKADLRMTAFIHYIDVSDPAGTARKIEEIADTYDGLIITCPNDPRLSDALRLHSAKLPIVTLVTDLPNCGRLAYVGADNRQMGRVVGELMGRFLGNEGGEVLIVLGMQRMVGHEEREMGFRTVLRERFPQCRILATLESGEDPATAGEVVAAALIDAPQVRGIYNASAGNMAIARSILAMGLDQHIVMITHELTASRRQLLRDGILDAVIDQNPRLEASRALDILAQHFQRGEIVAGHPHHTPFDIFIRENCPTIEAP
ncbi:LacI family DNA-binding transcriptional regulator [Devosia sp.]|uniref:LacI family DNA-binding transcriptional regulator n=1 Tax=Devosia sp. TaxID=1871048 RepID=UPI002AFEEBE2|nr:LacI family DNA-binding transcriptional regulator [Devosia sp.]